MLVSIVTPVFNGAQFIESAVHSVLAQSYKEIEYIIVDDGSDDGSAELVKKIDGSIKIISQRNSGQARALNCGWRHCSGQLLSYLSADDMLAPDCVEKIVAAYDGAEFQVLYPDYHLIDTNGMVIRTSRAEVFDEKRMFIDLVCQPGVAAFFTQECFARSGGWDPYYSHIGDFEFWTRVARFAKFVHLPINLGKFRVHRRSGSVRSIDRKSADEIIELVVSNRAVLSDNEYKLALSNAYKISARSDAQSFRYIIAIQKCAWLLKNSGFCIKVYSDIFFVFKGIIRGLLYKIKE